MHISAHIASTVINAIKFWRVVGSCNVADGKKDAKNGAALWYFNVFNCQIKRKAFCFCAGFSARKHMDFRPKAASLSHVLGHLCVVGGASFNSTAHAVLVLLAEFVDFLTPARIRFCRHPVLQNPFRSLPVATEHHAICASLANFVHKEPP